MLAALFTEFSTASARPLFLQEALCLVCRRRGPLVRRGQLRARQREQRAELARQAEPARPPEEQE